MDKHALIQQRQELLGLLYEKRLQEHTQQKLYVTERDLKDALGNCFFNLKLLLEAGQIESAGFKHRITAKGVEKYEQG